RPLGGHRYGAGSSSPRHAAPPHWLRAGGDSPPHGTRRRRSLPSPNRQPRRGSSRAVFLSVFVRSSVNAKIKRAAIHGRTLHEDPPIAPTIFLRGQINPRAAIDTGSPWPITRWSSTRTPTSCRASRSSRVIARSAALGSATPEGWLWAKITAQAL